MAGWTALRVAHAPTHRPSAAHKLNRAPLPCGNEIPHNTTRDPFCQPAFSLKVCAQLEIGSSRRCAVITADLTPWISSMRKYMSPRLVMEPTLFLSSLEFCRSVRSNQAPNCAPLRNCLKSPTVATKAEAVTGPTPMSCSAWRTSSLVLGLAQYGGLLREHQAELGQQAANAVDACGAFGLEAFAQAVDAQDALLLNGLDGHEMHLRAARGGHMSIFDNF